VNSTFLRSALFTQVSVPSVISLRPLYCFIRCQSHLCLLQVSYCSAAAVLSWKCGPPCDNLPGVQVLQAGGNDEQVPGCTSTFRWVSALFSSELILSAQTILRTIPPGIRSLLLIRARTPSQCATPPLWTRSHQSDRILAFPSQTMPRLRRFRSTRLCSPINGAVSLPLRV
jgi:hypothetical protein